MNGVLIVFTKAPVAGQVKTRLAADLGEQQALAVYQQLVHQSLMRLACVADMHKSLWISAAHPQAAAWAAMLPGDLHLQQGRDLGERMAAAIEYSFAQGYEQVILVGCDLPLLDAGYIEQAQRALHDNGVVFGPAEDGGYGLIGLREDHRALLPQLFSNMPWGTAEVMVQNRTRLQAEQVAWQELPVLWDVDVLADWQRWQALG